MLFNHQETISLPTAFCDICGRDVLTWIALDENNVESRMCVHCDRPVGQLQWSDRERLAELGYEVDPQPAKKRGCGGGGCGSCSR